MSQNFKSLSLKLTKLEGGGTLTPPSPLRRISWQQGLHGIVLTLLLYRKIGKGKEIKRIGEKECKFVIQRDILSYEF